MTDHTRARLAEQQEALVGALTRPGFAPPTGFSEDQIAIAADALAKKRLRTAQKTWPALADALGEQFEPLFRAYAQGNPLPNEGALADARGFLRFLLKERVDVHGVDSLRLLALQARRGFPIRWQIRRAGVGVAIRLWGGRVCTWRTRGSGATSAW